MSDRQDSPSRPESEPRAVPSSSPFAHRRASPSPQPGTRADSIARLASPVPSAGPTNSPPIRQIPIAGQRDSEGAQTPSSLPGVGDSVSLPGPGQSALAAAFQGSQPRASSPVGSPPLRPLSPPNAGSRLQENGRQSDYGSFDQRAGQVPALGQGSNFENAEVVRRHLVQPPLAQGEGLDTVRCSRQSPSTRARPAGDGADDERGANNNDEFSSLQLQGGDITREVYRWSEEAEAQSQGRGRGNRSQSFHHLRPPPESEVLNINSIKAPGGFRRNYLRRAVPSPPPSDRGGPSSSRGGYSARNAGRKPTLFTSNFIEFLSLYGHFAGEELEEDDEALGPDEYFSSDLWDEVPVEENEDGREFGEDSALLMPGTPGKRRRRRKERTSVGTTSPYRAFLLLLKSFVGTGVLFLPKAFLNGGMIFSNVVLLAVAAMSYYCFILLVNTRLKVEGSFGDMGGVLYGKWMRSIILFSIVISQIGFSSAYIVFTSENLQAFILAVSKCKTFIDIKLMIMMQLVIFLPLSLFRDINKLGATALVADLMILLGLIYLYYYDILTLVRNHGVADIAPFNPQDWTLFIGTAIFTFEGIGLIIPIQESMKQPHKFPPVLAGVMILITVVFLSMGALSYAAYGSSTQTVVILNLPQDDKFVNAVQFLYSLAILLSTPLQLFPAIRITENELFTRSGKYNPYIKWQKNLFRFLMVMLCAVIAWGGAGDLDKFVALVGSFACVPLVNVYPVSLSETSSYHNLTIVLLPSSFFLLPPPSSSSLLFHPTKLTVEHQSGY